MPDLQGITVVVTRPAHQAAGFSQALQQAGANAVLFPLIAVQECHDVAAAKARFATLAAYDTVLFISANAVEYGLALLDAQQTQTLRHLTLGAIGKKTAAVLQRYGLVSQLVPAQGFTSEDLLALPALRDLHERRVLIVRGEGGRELLADTLRDRGANVDYVDVYQRIVPQNAKGLLKHLHEARQLDIIAITSSEGILNLLALLDNPEWIKTVRLLVGSQRMVATARQAGFTGQMVVAANPGDEAMLHALHQWAQEFPR